MSKNAYSRGKWTKWDVTLFEPSLVVHPCRRHGVLSLVSVILCQGLYYLVSDVGGRNFRAPHGKDNGFVVGFPDNSLRRRLRKAGILRRPFKGYPYLVRDKWFISPASFFKDYIGQSWVETLVCARPFLILSWIYVFP